MNGTWRLCRGLLKAGRLAAKWKNKQDDRGAFARIYVPYWNQHQFEIALACKLKTIEGSKVHIYKKPSSCRYTRLTLPKKTCTDVINTLHVCPNWCLSVFENLSTVHRKVCGDVCIHYMSCSAEEEGRWHNIPALWCLSGTRACRQDNWSPGVDEVHMVPWWCTKKSNFGISSVRGCVLEKSRRNSSWKKMSSLVTFVWWVFCDVMGPLTVCIVTMSGSQVLHIQYSST